MKKEIISRFKERPKEKNSWNVLWLGLITLIANPLTGVINFFLRRIFDRISSSYPKLSISPGMLSVLITLILVLITANLFFKRYKRGERSWVIWVGLIPAGLVGLFWIIFILGEFLYPH